jgi:hypothetical protein
LNKSIFLLTLMLAAMPGSAQNTNPPQQQETGWVALGPGQSVIFSALYPSVPLPISQVLVHGTLIIEDANGNGLALQDFELTGAVGGRIATVTVNSDTAIPVGQRNVLIRAYSLIPNGGNVSMVVGLDIIDNATGRTVTHVPAQITFPKPATQPAQP